MSDNLNVINLVGRVGQQPETQYFESGAVLTKLSLAVNRRSNKKDSEPDWFALEIWGNIAEVAANYTDKGSLIGIQGELKLDEWIEQTTGQQRVKPVIRVHNLELLGSNSNSNSRTHTSDNSDTTSSIPDEDTSDF
ncbi:single-stranded DNA-binding protein [Planktothrix paucivesiculata]|uniref:Single-stranded DNA-binding protein n=1 Tax=Planktothrix paucivesiculata PCC 9631 TaxID=671071 RepID=A0A7Z9C3V4_9CYAN|nr:single-stranded DNA-binding protein [Planktothrix paucivesiculata]VXD25174.1 Single-stranded DNA-binding protein [Planktothrix paucivesiculata PCC 9631]